MVSDMRSAIDKSPLGAFFDDLSALYRPPGPRAIARELKNRVVVIERGTGFTDDEASDRMPLERVQNLVDLLGAEGGTDPIQEDKSGSREQ
jgi:hypothetical protein